MRQGPLAGRYPAAAAMVMFALIPYLALSAAIGPVTPLIGRDLHISPQAMSVGSGMANAAYAAGTVMAVYFAQLLRQRRIMLVYVSLLRSSVRTSSWNSAPPACCPSGSR